METAIRPHIYLHSSSSTIRCTLCRILPTSVAAATLSPPCFSHLHPRAPVNPLTHSCPGNFFLLSVSCLLNKFDSTVSTPSPSPACVLPLSARPQPCRAPKDRSCLGVLAPASRCRVTISGGEPVAGHYPHAETSCCNIPVMEGERKGDGKKL